MKMASWIVLTIVGLLIALFSFGSMGVAYMGAASSDLITGTTSLADLSLSEDVATALRGRRGTAAAYGFAFATMFLIIVLGPYRKGEVWAWWALLCPTVVLVGILALRIPTLGASQGVSTGVVLLVAVGIGLLLDVRRLMR